MKIIAFRTPKPHRFDYKPLFYNPDKEKLERQIKLSKQLGDSKNPSYDKSDFREEMRSRWEGSRRKKQSSFFAGSSILLLLAAFALIFVMLYLVYSSGIF